MSRALSRELSRVRQMMDSLMHAGPLSRALPSAMTHLSPMRTARASNAASQLPQQQRQQQQQGMAMQQPASWHSWDFFGDPFVDLTRDWPLATAVPRADVYWSDKALNVKVDCPGVPQDKLRVEVDDATGRLLVSGDVEEERKEDKNEYHVAERFASSFRREFTLPDNVDVSKVDAEYRDGVLTITLAKKEIPDNERERKRVAIRSAGSSGGPITASQASQSSSSTNTGTTTSQA